MTDNFKRRKNGLAADTGFKKYLVWLPLAGAIVVGIFAWSDGMNAIAGSQSMNEEQKAQLVRHEERLRKADIQRAVIQQQIKTIVKNGEETKQDVKMILLEVRRDQ